MVCDDGNACSDDFCLDGSCETSYLPSPGCCVLDGDCNDHNPCTDDTCGGSAECSNTPIPGCCLGNAECADADTCTLDMCAPRNRGALILDSPYDHASMVRPGYTGGEIRTVRQRLAQSRWARDRSRRAALVCGKPGRVCRFVEGGAAGAPRPDRGRDESDGRHRNDQVAPLGWELPCASAEESVEQGTHPGGS